MWTQTLKNQGFCATTLALFVMMGCAASAFGKPTADNIPHLRTSGNATQLIVDGKPYLALAGELANTASSSLEYMEPVWPRLAKMNLNTVLVAVAWAWVEPQEGKYDFSLVDGLLAGARKHNLRVMLLWFGSWKNGLSSFAPAWVKADQKRFPAYRLRGVNPSRFCPHSARPIVRRTCGRMRPWCGTCGKSTARDTRSL